MTAPLPLKPPRDFENITFREVVAAVRTGENGDPTPTPNPGVQPVSVPLPILDGGDVSVLLAQPSDATDYGWARPWYDSTGQTHVRAIVDVETGGAEGAEVFGEYSADSGATFDEPTTPVAISIANAGQYASGWIALNTEALGDRIWGMRARGGDDDASPVIKKAHLQFRQQTATRPPRGGTPPGDLPESEWGNIIFDADTGGVLFTSLAYADDDEVDMWPDEIAGRHLRNTSPLNIPHYHPTGFTGALPCVQFSGAGGFLSAPNPAEWLVEWTWYFIIDDLDGGDASAIWGDPAEPPSFGHQLRCDSDTLYGHVNTVFNGNNGSVEDDWNMATPHIYRWVKSSGDAAWRLYVDGVMKIEAAANPQASGSDVVGLMIPFLGLDRNAKIGRCVAYNKAHVSPVALSVVAADGLTGPELVLKPFWGTP